MARSHESGDLHLQTGHVAKVRQTVGVVIVAPWAAADAAFTAVQEALHHVCGLEISVDKTQVWSPQPEAPVGALPLSGALKAPLSWVGRWKRRRPRPLAKRWTKLRGPGRWRLVQRPATACRAWSLPAYALRRTPPA